MNFNVCAVLGSRCAVAPRGYVSKINDRGEPNCYLAIEFGRTLNTSRYPVEYDRCLVNFGLRFIPHQLLEEIALAQFYRDLRRFK